MTKNQKWLLGILLTVFILGIGLFFAALLITAFSRDDFTLAGSFGERIGVLEIKGIINDSDELRRQIKFLREDQRVRAVVVRINSPGGAVAPSQEIFEQLSRLRDETDKPVVVSMGTVAASGGYYIACAADSILAVPGTLTGSIGVLLEFPDLHEILKKVGIDFKVIKSAEHKDIGSPFRPITDEEKRILQEMVDDVFYQFVEVVSVERGLPWDSVMTIADGRVFSGRQAKELGLVDRTGSFQDALDMAGRMCGLGENPKIIRPSRERRSMLDFVAETATRLSDPASGFASPRLLYLFR
ncbi:MAG TPA: signal peptide peptidase SppA [archaeon]|nr:signal peptide peptidase SppA [archaeon]